MIDGLAWACAWVGIALGGAAILVPGFPGCVVAFLGLAAFAGITDFAIITREGLVLAGGLTVVGALGQLAGPALASRALSGSAGAATGAVIGACLGLFVPVPGVGYGLALAGAALGGVVGSDRRVVAWLKGVVGAAGGCCVAAAVDGLGVLGCAAVLAISDFVAHLPA